MLEAAGHLQEEQIGQARAWGRRWRPIVAAALAASTVLVVVGVRSEAGATPPATVEAWGLNTYGQVGDGTTNSPTTPEQISLPGGVTPTAVAAGGYHSLAIGSDGNLYAWGQNGYGQLGDGTTTDSWTPEKISLPGGVQPKAIAAGLADSLALGTNGKVYAWGDNSFDELGNGSTASDSTDPRGGLPAGRSLTFSAISAGQYHNLAIGSNGKLYAWGYNVDGQLGDGNEVTPSTPVTVNMPSGVTPTAIAAGGFHSLAIGSDDNIYAWGYNSTGQLGDGTNTLRKVPVQVSFPNSLTPIAVSRGPVPQHRPGHQRKDLHLGLQRLRPAR